MIQNSATVSDFLLHFILSNPVKNQTKRGSALDAGPSLIVVTDSLGVHPA